MLQLHHNMSIPRFCEAQNTLQLPRTPSPKDCFRKFILGLPFATEPDFNNTIDFSRYLKLIQDKGSIYSLILCIQDSRKHLWLQFCFLLETFWAGVTRVPWIDGCPSLQKLVSFVTFTRTTRDFHFSDNLLHNLHL